jgi:PIN domain nuclease of toxin-antitoxin system
MRLLLDTHALLWMAEGSDQLSEAAVRAILDGRNALMLSVASWWEIAVKMSLGRLKLQSNWAAALKREMRHNGVDWLPVLPEHCERLPHLPFHHRDPFDRLLIAQALCADLAIITVDPHFAAYGVTVVW